MYGQIISLVLEECLQCWLFQIFGDLSLTVAEKLSIHSTRILLMCVQSVASSNPGDPICLESQGNQEHRRKSRTSVTANIDSCYKLFAHL